MPIFHDIALVSGLTQSRSRWSFAEYIERELWYSWDGTSESKIMLMKKLQEEWKMNMEESYSKVLQLESNLLPILARMESQWVCIDTEKLENIGIEIEWKIQLLETEIYEVTGEFFNINSPKQIQVLLFEKLWIKPTKKNKTGYSVDNEVLEEIAKEYDIARLILEYRWLSKLQSTYIEALLKTADKNTRRVHTTYHQLWAATGRMSSNDPNLQNIPTGIGYANDIKSCFIPSEGNIFIVADYSQIEIRVLAWLSGDMNLLEAFKNGEDIHARTARFLFAENTVDREGEDIKWWKSYPEQRRIAKTVNFWVIYGITGFGLSKTLNCSPWEADIYIKAFYEKYPWVRAYYDHILEDARKNGYVETAFGRRRYIPWVNDANKTIRSIAEREAINMPIQWTAADMIKLAMCDIDAKIRDRSLLGKMILQVHDELVFDVPVDEKDAWISLVKESMENVITHHLEEIIEWINPNHTQCPPISVDIHAWVNWVDAKG